MTRFARNVLILAYHSIYPSFRGPLSITPEEFGDQMAVLKGLGYTTLTVWQYFSEFFSRGNRLPRKHVVITFDDGYLDNLEYVAPLLERHGFTATVFVTTGYIGTDRRFPWQERVTGNDVRCLSWQETAQLLALGWEIGSHTVTHPFLTTLSERDAWREIEDSKKQLEQQLGVPVRSFCYPAGNWDKRVRTLVERAGYRTAVVTPSEAGTLSGPFSLKRVGIYGLNSPLTFRLKISPLFHLIREIGLLRLKKWL